MLTYKTTLISLLFAAFGLGAPTNAATVFTETFSTGTASPEFSGEVNVVGVEGYEGLGGFADNFLRNTSAGNPALLTILTLTGLAAHTAITIVFDLALIDSWDSNDDSLDPDDGAPSPDIFNLTLDGMLVLEATAANASGSFTGLISGGATLVETVGPQALGFTNGQPFFDYDTGFRVEYTQEHSATTAVFAFFASGKGWQAGEDESWAIDNVTVSIAQPVGPPPVPLPAGLPLLITALSAVALLRRRRG